MSVRACPYCGVIATPEVMAGHTRQECEAKILARIEHQEQIIALERGCLTALRSAAAGDSEALR